MKGVQQLFIENVFETLINISVWRTKRSIIASSSSLCVCVCECAIQKVFTRTKLPIQLQLRQQVSPTLAVKQK